MVRHLGSTLLQSYFLKEQQGSSLLELDNTDNIDNTDNTDRSVNTANGQHLY